MYIFFFLGTVAFNTYLSISLRVSSIDFGLLNLPPKLNPLSISSAVTGGGLAGGGGGISSSSVDYYVLPDFDLFLGFLGFFGGSSGFISGASPCGSRLG